MLDGVLWHILHLNDLIENEFACVLISLQEQLFWPHLKLPFFWLLSRISFVLCCVRWLGATMFLMVGDLLKVISVLSRIRMESLFKHNQFFIKNVCISKCVLLYVVIKFGMVELWGLVFHSITKLVVAVCGLVCSKPRYFFGLAPFAFAYQLFRVTFLYDSSLVFEDGI